MQQGSQEWLALRKTKITGTDAPVILGCSPYSSAYELWHLKKGLLPEKAVNYAMMQGKNAEEQIRADFCHELGIEFFPDIVTPKDGFIMASLDGINFTKDMILEIKCCKKEYFDQVKEGNIPPHFYAQIQHQLMCVPTAVLAYLHCVNGSDKCTQLIKPDKAFQEELTKKEFAFFELLLDDVPPEASEKDYIVISDNPSLEKHINDWKQIKMRIDELDKLESALRKQIIEETDDGNCRAYGVEIRKSYCQKFDYKKACTENNIDLGLYKKELAVRWTFSIIKEKKQDVGRD